MIVATIPHYDEPAELVADAIATAEPDVRCFDYDAPLRYAAGDAAKYETESEMRYAGLAIARRLGADWWLQLDADERLMGDEALDGYLRAWSNSSAPATWAYPLPYFTPSLDQLTLAPFKLVRTGCELVCQCDYFTPPGGGELYRLSGFTVPREFWPWLLAGPHLLHLPELRTLTRARLSEVENEIEPRPDHALDFPLPPDYYAKGVSMSEALHAPPDEALEWTPADGDYACPGCGARYGTPGVCTGKPEAQHEPITVEKVAGGAGGYPTTHAELDKLAAEADGFEWPAGVKNVASKQAALAEAGIAP